jgi:hypothetical protein
MQTSYWIPKLKIFAVIFGINLIVTTILLNKQDGKSWHGWQGVYYVVKTVSGNVDLTSVKRQLELAVLVGTNNKLI